MRIMRNIMNTRNPLATILRYARLTPPNGSESRPANEIIRDVQEKEHKEAQKIHRATERVKSDPERPLTVEEFMRALQVEEKRERRED